MSKLTKKQKQKTDHFFLFVVIFLSFDTLESESCLGLDWWHLNYKATTHQWILLPDTPVHSVKKARDVLYWIKGGCGRQLTAGSCRNRPRCWSVCSLSSWWSPAAPQQSPHLQGETHNPSCEKAVCVASWRARARAPLLCLTHRSQRNKESRFSLKIHSQELHHLGPYIRQEWPSRLWLAELPAAAGAAALIVSGDNSPGSSLMTLIAASSPVLTLRA